MVRKLMILLSASQGLNIKKMDRATVLLSRVKVNVKKILVPILMT